MRLKLALVVVALLAVGFVMHDRKSKLEHRIAAVATQLGSRHVKVHCQSFAGNLVDVTSEAGSVRFDASGVPSDTTDLKRPVCNALKRFAKDVRGPAYGCVLRLEQCPEKIYEDVMSVHTLAHETWHLHGISSEAETECYALQTTARAAQLFGGDPLTAQATARYVLVFIFPNMPDEYRLPDCANGGPHDLRPTDAVWP